MFRTTKAMGLPFRVPPGAREAMRAANQKLSMPSASYRLPSALARLRHATEERLRPGTVLAAPRRPVPPRNARECREQLRQLGIEASDSTPRPAPPRNASECRQQMRELGISPVAGAVLVIDPNNGTVMFLPEVTARS
jgi:hypothetical protein